MNATKLRNLVVFSLALSAIPTWGMLAGSVGNDRTPWAGVWAESPPPKPPVLPLIDDARRAVWAQMIANKHPFMTILLDAAKKTGSASPIYNDFGQWAAMAYQITGDRNYAASAWARIRPIISKDPANANWIRENGFELALLYAWLRPALSDADAAIYAKGLNRWCEWCNAINTAQYVGGWRFADSDQTIGQYMTCAITDGLTKTKWLKYGKVGGLDVSAANTSSTARNAIAYYVKLASNGQWPESSEYNFGTLKLILLGAAIVNQINGRDCFPEVTALIRELADAMPFELTTSLKTSIQWGDDEHPRSTWPWHRLPCYAVVAGLNPSHGGMAKLVMDYWREVSHSGRWEPGIWRAVYVYNPYATTRPTTVEPSRYYGGLGMSRFKTDHSLFHAHFNPKLGIDHDVDYFGDFLLNIDDEFVINHPIGYGGLIPTSVGTNSIILAGLRNAPRGGPRTSAFQSGKDWCAASGTISGPFYSAGYYGPPPPFLDGWVRSIVHFSPNIIVVRDRLKIIDPRKLPRLNRYSARDMAEIKAMPALTQWVIHSPVSPTIGKNRLDWPTAGGKPIACRFLTPTAQHFVVFDEAKISGFGSIRSEQKWQTRLLNDATDQTIVAVLSAGKEPTATLNADGSVSVNGQKVQFAADGTLTIRSSP